LNLLLAKIINKELKFLNQLLIENNAVSNQNKEKFEEIVKISNEIRNKLYENYFQKYPELFFSSKELENINIIKLIKEGKFSRYEFLGNNREDGDDREFEFLDKDWTKVKNN
jgi:hypothetical protein